MKKKDSNEGIKIKGMFRINITEDGKLVGDSGWKKNLITNVGFSNYIVNTLGGIAGSSRVVGVALATGSAMVGTSTSLTGELLKRTGVTITNSASTTLRFTGTFGSAGSFITTVSTIQSIGLFSISSATGTAGGSIFAGNTFPTSAVATNQNINITYDIVFT